ncbi:glycosyltransferase [Methylomonas sp. YC3]
MGQYSSWFFERRRKKSPIKYQFRKILRKLNLLRSGEVRVKLTAEEENREWHARSLFLENWLQSEASKPVASIPRTPKVTHMIGSLQSGGAERQLCNCVIGMRRLGFNVSVMLIYKPTDEHGHYIDLLHKEGISVRVAGECFDPKFESAIKSLPEGEDYLINIPEKFRSFTIDILGELICEPPDIFHSWLDHPNIWGGVAALLAKIPLIVLSTRNVNPTHFPYLADPYLYAMYSQLARSPNIRFINNSYAGAEDYAKWLDIPKERFAVILNGVELDGICRASNQQVSHFRDELGISSDKEIIAGVFRLSEEKQPLIFLEVVRRIIRRRSTVVAVIAGIGPLEQKIREYISANQLDKQVFLLGRRNDVATIFSAAKVALLCSRQEGTPNVLLEAQWLGCPVVSTKAGGAVDAVIDGETGFLVNVGDVDGLEDAVIDLLENVSLRNNMVEAGANFIKQHFRMDRMVKETIAIYNN